MRLQHWLAPLLSVIVIASIGNQLSAQTPFPPGGPGGIPGFATPGMIGQPSTVPVQFGGPPGGGIVNPGAAGGWSPWPGISPYDNRFQQHTFDDGMWEQETRNDPARYFFQAEVMFNRYRMPGRDLVGADIQNPSQVDPLFAPVDVGVLQRSLVGTTVDPTIVDEERTNPRKPIAYSGKLIGGWWERDDSGFSASAWMGPDSSFIFSRGTDGRADDPDAPRVTAALPLEDGAGGVTVPYDLLFRLNFKQRGMGADANWIFTPYYETNILKVRPSVGMRYLFIDEEFSFRGRDSGATYTVNDDGSIDTGTFVAGTEYRSYLDSGVESNLLGPQIGLRIDLGGDNLKLISITNAGVLLNWEENDLFSAGIGDGLTLAPLGEFDNNPHRLSNSNLHVSPMFEQIFTAEMNLFPILPILKKWKALENAKIRVSYTITAVWEVSRPYNNIQWFGQPLKPELKTNRTHWYVGGISSGIIWTF